MIPFKQTTTTTKKRQNIFHISINNIQFAWYYYSDLCDSNLHRTFIQLFQSIFSFVLRKFFFRRIFVVRKKLPCFWIFLGIKIWKKIEKFDWIDHSNAKNVWWVHNVLQIHVDMRTFVVVVVMMFNNLIFLQKLAWYITKL